MLWYNFLKTLWVEAMGLASVLRFTLVYSFLLFSSVYAGGSQDAYQAGNNAVNLIKSKTGKGELNRNFHDPLKSDVKLNTLDGSKSGSVKLQCASSSSPVLTISFVPSSNNNYRLIVRQSGSTAIDTGSGIGVLCYNSSSATTVSSCSSAVYVSGYCDKGIVYCPNGWGPSCRYFYWDVDSGALRLVETRDRSLVGQCNCSDATCGWSNVVPYESIVGSIVRVMGNYNPKYSFTNGKWDLSTLTYSYYGTDMSNCAVNNKYSLGDTNPEKYYNGGSYPNASSLAASYASDSSNPYSLVTNTARLSYSKTSSGVSLGVPSEVWCTIKNIPKLELVKDYVSGVYSYRICADHFAYAYLERLNDTDFRIVLVGTGPGGDVGRNCDRGYWYLPTISVTGGVPTDYMLTAQYNDGGCNSHNSTVYGLNQWALWADCPVPDQQYPSGSFYYRIGYQRDNVVVSHSDDCPTNCKLVESYICDQNGQNCLKVVDSGVVIDRARPICFEYPGQTDSFTICSDGVNITAKSRRTGMTNIVGKGWFYVKRKYICGINNSSIDFSRAQGIMSSMNVSGNSATFFDPANLNKGLQSVSGPAHTDCVKKFCAVKVPVRTTEVYSDSSNKSTVQGGVTYSLEKRECTTTGSLTYNTSSNTLSYTCPVGAGETILAGCDCESNIDAITTTTISVLNAVEQAVKDMICSQQ